MDEALKQLLDALDKLAKGGHRELIDTDVRERMYDAVHQTLIEPNPTYKLPKTFGMFSPEANQKVKAALETFFTHPEFIDVKKLPTPKARLEAFENISVESDEGTTYDDYFGESDSL